MAGGSLTITTDIYGQLAAVGARVLCQLAAGNRGLMRTTTNTGPAGTTTAFVIPEEIFPGTLTLRTGGTNLLAGYVAGTNISYHAGNGTMVGTDVNTCPSTTQQPTVTSIVTNVGGNPRAITVNYANFAGNGTVNIYWGDGTSTLGAAESGAANHTYAPTTVPFGAVVRIEDASAPATFAEFVVRVP